ncbi:MAG: hypothetical protein V2B18_17485 [Pseudomonadota bacterium]
MARTYPDHPLAGRRSRAEIAVLDARQDRLSDEYTVFTVCPCAGGYLSAVH